MIDLPVNEFSATLFYLFPWGLSKTANCVNGPSKSVNIMDSEAAAEGAAAPAATAAGEQVNDTAEWLKEIRELCEVSMDAEVTSPFWVHCRKCAQK